MSMTVSMPVGVRGSDAASSGLPPWLPVAEIADRLSPEELTDSRYVIEPGRKDAVPALAALGPSRADLGEPRVTPGDPAAASASRSRRA